MRLSKRIHAAPLTASMTPMIDIVFLLIIFFMTLPQLTRVVYHQVELPTVNKINNQDDVENVTINMDQAGDLFFDSKQVSFGEAEDIIDRLLKTSGGGNRLQILLRADRRTQTENINDLIEMLNRKDIKQIRVSARSSF